jgi:ferredoxin like protein
MSINDKLLRTRFIVDAGSPHIKVDTAKCAGCAGEACLTVCPVECYRKEQQKLTFSWENCVECGSCRIICPNGAVSWNYPRGGFGVCFRYG